MSNPRNTHIEMTANQTTAARWAIESIKDMNETLPVGCKIDIPRILVDTYAASPVDELDLSSDQSGRPLRDVDITQFLESLCKCLFIDRRSVRGLARKILNYQLGFSGSGK
jgi:hypothetical protein